MTSSSSLALGSSSSINSARGSGCGGQPTASRFVGRRSELSDVASWNGARKLAGTARHFQRARPRPCRDRSRLRSGTESGAHADRTDGRVRGDRGVALNAENGVEIRRRISLTGPELRRERTNSSAPLIRGPWVPCSSLDRYQRGAFRRGPVLARRSSVGMVPGRPDSSKTSRVVREGPERRRGAHRSDDQLGSRAAARAYPDHDANLW